MCLCPYISQYLSEGITLDGRRLSRVKGGGASIKLSYLLPDLAVVVLPDDVGPCHWVSSNGQSVDPHPVISEGITIQDGVFAGWGVGDNYVPRWCPECVQLGGDGLGDGINLC